MVKVLFDTNILIDSLNGYSQAREVIKMYPDRAVSVVTQIELLAGGKPIHEVQVRTLLSGFAILQTEPTIAEYAATIRREQKLKTPDAIILATAQNTRRTLITRDMRIVNGDHGVACMCPYEI